MRVVVPGRIGDEGIAELIPFVRILALQRRDHRAEICIVADRPARHLDSGRRLVDVGDIDLERGGIDRRVQAARRLNRDGVLPRSALKLEARAGLHDDSILPAFTLGDLEAFIVEGEREGLALCSILDAQDADRPGGLRILRHGVR
ncbi:hypothetical protein ILT44_20085 [Microvirga sp. BT689]|uniref:hypothetical protein n=1 Tax=Microvirga arvi TaxID=2778731 RepID=UPI0019504FE2|nr:hypothetical protein [Microvirga arvi]MBM6582509.1 hypothetical protein [Microvirga arvi]